MYLFNQEGFVNDFFIRYHKTSKAIVHKIQHLVQKSEEKPKELSLKLSAVVAHCLYYLKNVLSLRLQCLFKSLESERSED